MRLSYVLALVILAVLVGLRFFRVHGRHFSTAFWVQLLAFALALGAGLFVGEMSFILSLVVLLVTLAVTNRAPRLADPQERDALRQQALGNLEAARRLRRLLEDEIKVHRAMREGFLPGVLPEERDQA